MMTENPILISADIINSTGKARAFYSTRSGGISSGCYSTLNLSWRGTDSPENIKENYKIACREAGIDINALVFLFVRGGDAVQKSRPRTLSALEGIDIPHKHCGKFNKKAIPNVDALITDEKSVTLTSRTADCVPVLILDEKLNCIGAVHSGWRGTLQSITVETLKQMEKEYGTSAADCLVSIGPCICKECFEVDSDVAASFNEKFGRKYCSYDGEKYHIDLVSIISDELITLGVPKKKISLSANICTACNTDMFFSHRAEHGNTGGMCAFLSLI